MILKEINTYNIEEPRGIGYLCNTPFIATDYGLYLGNDMILNTRLKNIHGIYCAEYIYLRNDDNLKILNHKFDIINTINLCVNNKIICIGDIDINYNDQFIISDCNSSKIEIFDSSFNYIESINVNIPTGIGIDIENKLYICSDKVDIYENNIYSNSININYPYDLCFYKNNLITVNNGYIYYNNKEIFESTDLVCYVASYGNKLCVNNSCDKVIEYEIIEEK